ncbi:MAG: hypothetical protein JEY94_02625 [Melioribacteraceae bacterium]|nr:hypothetical protein [Melioribacteraceae bacterium]
MRLYTFIMILSVLVIGCESNSNVSDVSNYDQNYDLSISPTKWYNGHSGTVTVTYDIPWSDNPLVEMAVSEIEKRNLTMDFELVTQPFSQDYLRKFVVEMATILPKRGIHVFGHGHTHINHDEVSFDEAYNSFKTCYDLMTQWGLNPKAYAYPGGRGKLPSTQLANKLAGFICARGAVNDSKLAYMCVEDEMIPENWYYLQAVNVGTDNPIQIENHSEMEPILESTINKRAWVILMYHSIGNDKGYSYYPTAEFLKDLDFIKDNDLWCGNMDQVALYIYERSNFEYNLEFESSDNSEVHYEITISDNLDNKIYDQELTLELGLKKFQEFESLSFYLNDSLVCQKIIDKEFTLVNLIPDENTYSLILKKK